jgi:hypothetical protein
MKRPVVRERMLAAGFNVSPKSAEFLRKHIAAELALWKMLVQTAGIKQKP